MHLFFIRNIPIEISSNDTLWNNTELFDFFLEGNADDKKLIQLQGNIIIKINNLNFYNWVRIIMLKGGARIDRIIFLIDNINNIQSLIKDKFTIVQAAGGVVEKEKNILMVFRSGKWELPKGKLERNENFESAAVREIKEECNVDTKIIDSICSTWYTYMIKGRIYFKHVEWFEMICLQDKDMKPQLEEGITKVAWISFDKLKKILSQSYLSISFTIEEYFKKLNHGRS